MSDQRAYMVGGTYIFTVDLAKQCSPALRFLHSSLKFVFLHFIWLPKPIFTGNTEEAKEFWTFKMVGRLADRCVTEPITHRGQLFNCFVQLICLG